MTCVNRRENYRQKAAECAEAAEGASDATERLALLEIAQVWLRLADHAPSEGEPQLPLHDRDESKDRRGVPTRTAG